MTLSIEYNNREKITALSSRLKCIAKIKSQYQEHIDYQIRSDNLKYNLSLLLSRIILNSTLMGCSKSAFMNIVNEYNTQNETQLQFADFEKTHWIRIINDEIKIPEAVTSYLRKIKVDETNTTAYISNINPHIFSCLRMYYQICNEGIRPFIQDKKLVEIFNEFINTEVNINYLTQNKILEYDSETCKYFWMQNDYLRYLRNELTACLWKLIGAEKPDENQLRKYIRLLEHFLIWSDNIALYLSPQEINEIAQLSLVVLKKEQDLDYSKDEVKKIWLDSTKFSYATIDSQVPDLDLDSNTTLELIEEIESQHSSYLQILHNQELRRLYSFYYDFILQNENNNTNIRYQDVINLLKLTEKPYLVYSVYFTISKNYPEIIPYLLSESELIPIALRLIDNIEINKIFLTYQESAQAQLPEEYTIKNKIWLDLFDIALDIIPQQNSNVGANGNLLFHILYDVSKKLFKYDSFTRNGEISHNAFKNRYSELLKILISRKDNGSVNFNQKITASSFVEIFERIINKNTKLPYDDNCRLDLPKFYLSIDALKAIEVKRRETEFHDVDITCIQEIKKKIIVFLASKIEDYFSTNEVETATGAESAIEKKIAKRQDNEFGLELIDWGYLYLQFQQKELIDQINSIFDSSLVFDDLSNGTNDSEQNHQQFVKIKFYLKILLQACNGIQNDLAIYKSATLPVKETLNKLRKIIISLAINHSVDDISNKRVDVFVEDNFPRGYNLYHKSMIFLLFKTVNLFEFSDKEKFITEYFKESNDLGRMLTAINIIDSKPLEKIITDRLSNIDIEEYITSRFSITELETTLVESINSKYYWDKFTEPLITRIQSYYEHYKSNSSDWQRLFFEVKLLFAFKQKDNKKLNEIELQENPSVNLSQDKIKNRKDFFIALSELYYEKKYSEACAKLEDLFKQESKDIFVAYHLYKARTLNALKIKNNQSLGKAYQDWNSFEEGLKDKERQGIGKIHEALMLNNLYYYSKFKQFEKFDQAINTLSPGYLFDEEIIPIIFEVYSERDMHEYAFDYLVKAEEYYRNNELEIPNIIREKKELSADEKTLTKLKLILGALPSQRASDIPRILPNSLNGYHNLNEFILCEIINATRVMVQKIEAIRDISKENRYNDLLLAILRLRVVVWGWNIADQARTGISAKGKDAGEADHVITAAGSTIALFEAFILGGEKYTKDHILKCFGYDSTLARYYIIVYSKDPSENFKEQWTKYQKHVLSIDYPEDLKIKEGTEFTDISNKFSDIRHLSVAKTIHNDGKIEMFHIMINLESQ